MCTNALSVFQSQSINQSIDLSIYPSISQSVSQLVSQSIHQSINLSICQPVNLSICQSVCLPACMSSCLKPTCISLSGWILSCLSVCLIDLCDKNILAFDHSGPIRPHANSANRSLIGRVALLYIPITNVLCIGLITLSILSLNTNI